MRRVAVAGCMIAVLALPAAVAADLPADGPLTIWSSLPLQGVSRDQARAIVRGEQLALAQAGSQAGGRAISYRSLDDSTRAAGNWDPEQVFDNARRAAQEETTIGYLGEFNSGASSISIPILNQAGIPQISPTNTYTGLTRRGVEPGEPDKFYPTGVRTYARISPNDHLQAAALVSWLRADHVKRIVIVSDGETYGTEIKRSVTAFARKAGITVVRTENASGGGVAKLFRGVKADALVYGGIVANGAPEIFRKVHAGHRRWKLYGTDGVCEPGMVRALDAGTRKSFRCTVSTLALSAYPGGRRFVDAFKAKYGTSNPDPYAIYGYESMSLLLDAIDRAAAAGPLTRQGVVAQLFATKDRDSAIGRYSIDANGDTTSRLFGGYAVRDGRLRYVKKLDSTGL